MRDFEHAAKTSKRGTVVGEFWRFLWQTKKWWLAPIIVILVLLGLLVAASGTAVAPFIYTLF